MSQQWPNDLCERIRTLQLGSCLFCFGETQVVLNSLSLPPGTPSLRVQLFELAVPGWAKHFIQSKFALKSFLLQASCFELQVNVTRAFNFIWPQPASESEHCCSCSVSFRSCASGRWKHVGGSFKRRQQPARINRSRPICKQSCTCRRVDGCWQWKWQRARGSRLVQLVAQGARRLRPAAVRGQACGGGGGAGLEPAEHGEPRPQRQLCS